MATEAERYEVLEKIGQGSFGVIRKVRRKDNGQIMCRKEISYSRMSQKEKEQLHAELQILQQLQHPNIVAYAEREHLKQMQDLHLYMEYCGNGDLGGYIKRLQKTQTYADEDFVWTIFAQLVSALYRCHYGENPPAPGHEEAGGKGKPVPGVQSKQGHRIILHRDLKPENVFLGENNSVKLGDFGLSKIIASHDFASTYVGTPFYMSPEICAAERYSHSSDIWSLGCIIYELCSREPPFNARSHFELIQKIKVGRIAALPRQYSSELSEVINWCLKVDPRARPDTAQLLGVSRIKLARTRLETVNALSTVERERDQALYKLTLAQKQITELQAEVKRLQGVGKQMEMEWHAKATLAISERVQQGTEAEKKKLQDIFQAEVDRRVDHAVGQHIASLPTSHNMSQGSDHSNRVRSSTPPPATLSSFQTTATTAATTTSSPPDDSGLTDLTSLSLEEEEETSPLAQRQKLPLKKSGRTPFTRARTLANCNEIAPSPMDIHMADPSPMSIKGLSLSPRRNGQERQSGAYCAPVTRRNIFATAASLSPTSEEAIDSGPKHSGVFADGDDGDVENDSPSRPTSGLSNHADPFKVLAAPPPQPFARPGLMRQKTMPVNSHPSLQPRTNVFSAAGRRSPVNKENRPPSSHGSYVPVIAASPQRNGGKVLSPSRKAPPPPKSGDMARAVQMRNLQGKTLVQLQQGRSAPPSTSPAKWCLERDGDDMPSPFLKKQARSNFR